jgi:hypothetical protein
MQPSEPRVADEPRPGDDSPGTRAYRRGFRQKSKRDDYALDLFGEARAKLGSDRERVAQILGELSRLYNPLANGPIVDLATCAAIMARLQAGRTAEAEALLEHRYQLYAPIDDGDRRGPGIGEN